MKRCDDCPYRSDILFFILIFLLLFYDPSCIGVLGRSFRSRTVVKEAAIDTPPVTEV